MYNTSESRGLLDKSLKLAERLPADIDFTPNNSGGLTFFFGNQEKAGRVEAGDHSLTDIDPAVNDNAVDRGFDSTVTEIPLGFLQHGLRRSLRSL